MAQSAAERVTRAYERKDNIDGAQKELVRAHIPPRACSDRRRSGARKGPIEHVAPKSGATTATGLAESPSVTHFYRQNSEPTRPDGVASTAPLSTRRSTMDDNHAGRVAGTADPAGPRRQEPGGFPIDPLCINTIRTLSMDAVQQATPATLARPWVWRRWLTPVATYCAMTGPSRTGRTATGWCCPTGTPPCSSTPY
jgi:hypothetical protein